MRFAFGDKESKAEIRVRIGEVSLESITDSE
jgi:hypothetical protein